VRFQINIFRPGKKPKKVPRPKEEERRISVVVLIPLLFLLLLGISFAYMKASASLDRRMQWNRRQKVYLGGQLKQVEEDQKKAEEELTPDDLWLTDLSIKTIEKRKRGSREVEEETYLTVKGVTVPMPGREPLQSIARLISSLNSLDSFGRDFEPATLVYTNRSREKDRELMEFELSSKLKGGPGVRKEKASQ
jgi:hypothetical protein